MSKDQGTSMVPKFVIHLLSGGLDSVTLLHDLLCQGCRVHCLLFNYGQKHNQELRFAKFHCEFTGTKFTVMDLPQFKGSTLTDGCGSVVVPFRNSALISLAVNFASSIKADAVTLGCNQDDAAMFQDCRHEFLEAINRAVALAGVNVEVCYPYASKTKREIVQLARYRKWPIAESWSCYEGGKEPCGECLACEKRKEALA